MPRSRQDRRPARADGHGFGVVTADVNDDGLIDIFVANDMNPNFLFLNRGDGTFDDVSEISGAAFDINGMAQSGMGVDAEDVDGDGLPELFVTNFANEYNTLYQNFGKGIFFDNTAFFGLASDSMPWVKWGCALADFDNDGWPDCFFVNGHVDNNRRELGQPVDYEEIPLLVPQPVRQRAKRFRLATRDAGPYFDTKHVGRARPSATSTTTATSTSWSTTRTARPPCCATTPSRETTGFGSCSRGPRATATSIGAKIEVTVGGRDDLSPAQGRLQHAGDQRSSGPGGSGPATTVEKVVIRWPSGREITLENLKVDQDYKIVEPKTDTAKKPAAPAAKDKAGRLNRESQGKAARESAGNIIRI